MAHYFGFHAVIHVVVDRVRNLPAFTSDVVHERTDDDPAHSNVVVYDLADEKKLTFASALVDILTVTPPDRLADFEATRI